MRVDWVVTFLVFALAGVAASTNAPLLGAQQAATAVELAIDLGHEDGISSVAYSPDARYVVTAGGRTAQLWETATGRRVRLFQGHTGTVWAVDFSPDGRYVVTASADELARLWELDE